jgi:CAAX prenyl protease-like protein
MPRSSLHHSEDGPRCSVRRSEDGPRRSLRFPDWVPYVLPYAAFLLLTFVGGELLGETHGLYLYPVKILLVAGLLVFFFRRGAFPELSLRPSFLGIGAGLIGFALWVLPERVLAPIVLGESSFDPKGSALLVVARLAGAVLVVPVFEELFLRSFLPRWIDGQDDFRSAPVGRFRAVSFAVVVLAMALTHHRWLRAGIYSALLNLVLMRERRLGPVVWAHAVTNLALGVYVLVTGEWGFW